MSTTTRASMLMLLLLTAGCTVQQTETPALTGPSELALRLALQALPDSILQDGASQAALQIEASGPDGAPVRGLGLRIEIFHQGVIQDFGTLSAKTVVTGEDGRARAIYTAPPQSTEPVDEGKIVTFRVTPIGSDFGGQTSRTVDLRLVTPGVIQAPNRPPVPLFTSTGPLVPNSDIIFDASTTTDEGEVCGADCTFQWEFGDGGTATGVFVKHQFRTADTFFVKLTATDRRGASASSETPIQIGQGTAPTASFTFLPENPLPGQLIFFNGSASTAGEGRQIVTYDWDFEVGRGNGVTVTRSFSAPGNYLVRLTVTDDTGQTGTTAQLVTVGNTSTLQASLQVLPSTTSAAPAPVGTVFVFDASGSTGAAPIVEYRFSMGDGSPDGVQTTLPTWSHQYSAPGVYVARVTVRDAQGRTATATVTVYVQ